MTLDFPKAGFTCPGYVPRRPLRSRTYDALNGLLSLFRTNLGQLQNQEGDDSGAGSKLILRNECGTGGAIATGKLIQLDYIAESDGHQGFLEDASDGIEAVLPILNHQTAPNCRRYAASKKTCELEITVAKNQTVDCNPEVSKRKENDHSFLDIQMDDFSAFEELPEDNRIISYDVPKVPDIFMAMDVVDKTSGAGVDVNGADSVMENLPNKMEHELKAMEMGLEKILIDSSGLASSGHPDTDDIEDGEISGDDGAADVSVDSLSQNTVLVGERLGQMVPDSVNSVGKSVCDYQESGLGKYAILHNQENVGSKSENSESRKSSDLKQVHSWNTLSNTIKHLKTNPTGPSFGNITPSSENAIETQNSDTSKMDAKDDDARKNKRKRAPLTKEKRDKKKKKERMKRAEKNRELGVKRLKLLPVSKPRTKEFCRHFMKGRCSEGEKCKFSHDTVPLTKSKPCSHFARNSCMKGDDCPYDHQLSKYPCTNYATKGYCSRGTYCLFSHESSVSPSVTPGPVSVMASEKGGSSMISKITRADAKLTSPLNDSKNGKQVNVHPVFRQEPAGKSVSKGAELSATKPPLVTPAKIPNGVSFLCSPEIFSGDTHKLKQNGPSMRISDDSETAIKALGSFNKLKVAPRIPRGVNFLSFTKLSSDDLDYSKILPNLLLNGDQGAVKPVVNVTAGHDKLTSTSSESNRIVPVDSQHNPQKDVMASTSTGAASGHSAGSQAANLSGSSKGQLMSSKPSMVQRAVSSTLAFAAKIEAGITARPS